MQIASINLYLPVTKIILMKIKSVAILGAKCNKPNAPSQMCNVTIIITILDQ
jgi:hypothetical protein